MKKLKKLKKTNIKLIGLEFIGAFLGVLIALLLNNWQEDYKQNRFIQELIENIYRDNSANLKATEIQQKHFQRHRDSIRHYMKNDSLAIIDLIIKNGGLQTKSFVYTGYQVLLNSSLISKLDYELISQLTSNSNSYEAFNSHRKNTISSFYQHINTKSKDSKFRFYLSVGDMKNGNDNLQHSCKILDSLLLKYYPRLEDYKRVPETNNSTSDSLKLSLSQKEASPKDSAAT